MAGEIISMHVEGLDALLADLQALPAEIADKELRGMVFAGAKTVRDLAKGYLVNVHGALDTGSLRDGIRVGFDKLNSSAVQKQFNVFVSNRVKKRPRPGQGANRKGSAKARYQYLYYWKFIEFGTSRQRARPFLRPALDENKALIVNLMQERLRKGIERQARKLKLLRFAP
jgi:HK97 gp10 family phage protein